MGRNDVTISVGVDAKGISQQLSALRSDFLAIGATITAVFAGAAVKNSLKAFTDAASVQEDAINQLNTSLKLAGDFSEDASQSFQDLASQLQSVTTIGDETTLGLAALARNFTSTNEQAQELTKAALDLSAATGISLEGSVKNLGKTLAGLTGELGESIPELRELSEESLKSGKAIEFVAQRFGGAAAALRNTFSGALQATMNSFGDLLEEIGFAITQNPQLIGVLNELSDGFSRIGQFVKDNREEIAGFISQVIIGLIKALAGLTDSFIDNFDTINKVIRTFVNVAVIGFNGVQNGIDGLLLAFSELIRGTAKLRGGISELFGFKEAAKDAANTEEVYKSLSESIAKDIKVRSREITDLLNQAVEGFNREELSPENSLLLKTLEKISEELKQVEQRTKGLSSVGGGDTAQVQGEVQAQSFLSVLISGFNDFGEILAESFKENALKALDQFGKEFVNILATGTKETSNKTQQIEEKIAQRDAAKSSEERKKLNAELLALQEEQANIAREGASQFVGTAAAAATDAFLPGAGQFVKALLELAQDPESFKAFIQGFTEALPEIIDAIVEGLPEIIDALVEAMPDIISALVEGAPRIGFTLIEALVNNADDIVIAIVNGLTDGISGIFENLKEDINDFLGTSGGGPFQVGGTLGQASEAIKKALPFNTGGIVPSGFPNDTGLARVTSGEMILNNDQQQNLFNLLSKGVSIGGGSQMISVNLVLNDEILANTILDLNRDNKRIA